MKTFGLDKYLYLYMSKEPGFFRCSSKGRRIIETSSLSFIYSSEIMELELGPQDHEEIYFRIIQGMTFLVWLGCPLLPFRRM